MGDLIRFLAWPLRQLAYAALLTSLGWVGAGLWIFLHDEGDFAQNQQRSLRALAAENVQLKAAVVEADRRLEAGRTRLAAQKLRADQADKVVQNLNDLSGTFDWLTVPGEQLKENESRLERMKLMETNARERISDLNQGLVQIQWEKDGMELALARNQARLTTVAAEGSPWRHYGRRAWAAYGAWIVGAVVALMLLPPGWRLWRFVRD